MLEQEIDPFLRAQVSGRIVTLAGWMRADRPGLLAFTPAIQYNQTVVQDSVYLGTEWQYVTTAASLPVTTTYLAVRLSGPLAPGTVFYDSLSLIESYAPGDGHVPDGIMEAALAPAGTPQNLLRNAGAEQEIPRIPPALQRMTRRFVDPAGLERALEKTWSPQWIAAVYPRQSIALFQGFWGVFGWGEISVPARWFSSLGLLVILSVLGNIRYAWNMAASPAMSRELLGRRAWALCVAAVILGWGMALARVHLQPIPGAFVWSFGRYAFVALAPSMVLLIVGLAALLPRPLRQQGIGGVVGFLLVFALSAWIATLIPYWNSFIATP